MDLSSIHPKDAAEATPAAQQAGTLALGGLFAPFAQLVQSGGLRLNAGLDPFAVHAAANPTELAPPADDHAYQRRDLDADGTFDDRPADAPQADRSPPPDDRPDGHDDFGRERAAERGDNRTEPPHNEDPSGGNASDTAADDDTGTTEPPDAEAGAGTDDTETAEAAGTVTPDETAAPTQTGAPAVPGPDQALDQATAVLAGLIPSTDAAALPGQAPVAAQDKAAAQGHSQRQNAADGLTRAQNAVTAAAARPQAAPGTTAPAAEEAPTGDPRQSAPSDGNRPAATAATQIKGASPTTPAGAQSAALSEKIGPGNPVQVRVVVTDPAEQVVSRPASTLSTPSIFGGANPDAANARTQGGQGSQGSQGGQGGQGGQVGTTQAHSAGGGNAEAGQAAQNAAVAVAPGQGQQTSAQAALARSAPTAGAGIGGPAQGAANANPSAQPLQASGDTGATGNAGAPAGAEQAQQAKAAGRPAAASRPPSFKPAVADQVNVQIIKALKNGVDRINIQLRPAFLGRIDVQMEMAQDGRVIAIITADNKDTLDLLQRDAKDLQKALQDAGLQADSDSLSFNLRGDGNDEAGEDGRAAAHAPAQAPEDAEADGQAAGESLDDILDRLIAGDFETDDPGRPRIDIQV